MLNPAPWVVHKFGGSSVADADCFRRVAAILESAPAGRLGVVLSACRGVTDALLGLVALAERQDKAFREELTQLRVRHAGIATELLTPGAAQSYLAGLDRDCHDLLGVLHTVRLTRTAAHSVRDLIAGYGEIWSTRLFQSFFAQHARRAGAVQWLDARRVVVAQWGPLGPGVQWAESRAKLAALVPSDFKGTLVITGFIASDQRGVQTTLGRNGSDFSASIFGALLGASEIHIWTDVDGVLSADPRRVPDATVIDSLSYSEAMELAYFGAKVIHPQTMAPAVKGGIPIWIRNTFAPEKIGTLICAQPESRLPVKGITSIERVALAILAVVGDGMAGTPGIAGKVFAALGTASVNVRAIAQGASERNISAVVEGKSATRALRAVHAGLYLSPHTISIGVIGPGTVGRVLLDQLASQSERLRRQCKLDLRVRGVLASRRMLLAEPGVALGSWRAAYEESDTPADLARFVEHVRVDYLPHTVLIDCTASAAIAAGYAEWLAAGVHIVTPNKKANSADLAYYQRLHEARRAGAAHYLYEATVGAGLPVIHTLRDLRETGDEIRRIDGIFSGTLAYLFNVYDGATSFSQIVREARARGFTEPDPRDDLSGQDVARKLIILGRDMGLELELKDVRVESLVPAELAHGAIEEFMIELPRYDGAMAERLAAARERGKVLRYTGTLTAAGEATVGLRELEAQHPFANIALTDNVVRFATRRYCDNPLIVQGPGAGPEVTAGGVFADLLRLAAYLGARL